MDKAVSVLFMALIIVIIVCGEVYLRMDKNRSLALVIFKRMYGGLNDWLDCAEKIFSKTNPNGDTLDEFNALVSQFRAEKKGHTYKHVSGLNKICQMTKNIVAENIDSLEVTELAREMSSIYFDLVDLKDEYNRCAILLNDAMTKSISGSVAKLFRMKPLDRLDDLVVI